MKTHTPKGQIIPSSRNSPIHPNWVFVFLLLTSLSLFLSACGRETPILPPAVAPADDQPSLPELPTVEPRSFFTGDEDEILILVQSDTLDPEVLASFQEENDLEITEDNFDTDLELFAIMDSFGRSESYALIFPSDQIVRAMKREGMLAKLDQGNVPNLKYLANIFRNTPEDPGNEYCAPLMWGTVGLGYNPERFSEPLRWSILFESSPNDAHYGKMTMLDDARLSFAAALLYLGYDINTTDESQLEQAKITLIRAKPGLAGFANDTLAERVTSGDLLLAYGKNSHFLSQYEFEDFGYSVPEEGGVLWTNYVCIPNTASPAKKAIAEKFINFLLRPDISALVSENVSLATTNEEAFPYLTDFTKDNDAVYPSGEVLGRLKFIQDLGDFERVYQNKWMEVLSAP